MNYTRLGAAAAIIALVVVGGFILSVPHTTRDTKTSVEVPPASTPTVSLRDVFKKGVHTITGSLTAPNACAAISTTVTLQGTASSSQGILIQIAMPTDSGICLQVPTVETFQSTLTAPAHLPFTVMVNGMVATTTLL